MWLIYLIKLRLKLRLRPLKLNFGVSHFCAFLVQWILQRFAFISDTKAKFSQFILYSQPWIITILSNRSASLKPLIILQVRLVASYIIYQIIDNVSMYNWPVKFILHYITLHLAKMFFKSKRKYVIVNWRSTPTFSLLFIE